MSIVLRMREKDSKPTFEDKLAVFKMNKKAFGDVDLLVDSLSAYPAPKGCVKNGAE